ncbi:hypothetical protein Ciccas_004172 [Cichlidogyrus casuarinus]|uniref:Uncharacterized protein n=1 Tax=Cichlidogyrus casuarinus TaxID=1844966 RepID=A0ABD2QCD6_9PLAT
MGLRGDYIVKITGPALLVYEYESNSFHSTKYRWSFKHIRSFGVEEDLVDQQEPIMLVFLLMGSKFPSGRGRLEFIVLNATATEMYTRIQMSIQLLKCPNDSQQSSRLASSTLASTPPESPLPVIEESELEHIVEEEGERTEETFPVCGSKSPSEPVHRRRSIRVMHPGEESHGPIVPKTSAFRRGGSCNSEPAISSSLSGLKRVNISSQSMGKDFKLHQRYDTDPMTPSSDGPEPECSKTIDSDDSDIDHERSSTSSVKYATIRKKIQPPSTLK